MAEPFLWGAATSAHQVEGNNTRNDWWAFEQSNPKMTSSGRAADHYTHFREDFKLAKGLGHNAHRLSLEWSRLEPKKGEWDERAFEHYRQVLEELKRQGMVSFVTLHHFTNPLWLARAGGWARRGAVEAFVRYVEMVAHRLGDLIDFWVTINESMVYASQAYWHRRWPPQKKNAWAVWRVVNNMASAHRRVYRIIHRALPGAKVGIAKHLVAYADDQALKDRWFNQYLFKLVRGHQDFIGVNYYFKDKDVPWQGARSDIDWPIYPEGLKQVLLRVKQYNLPVYVTENGVADADDSKRADFIRDHLRAVEQAQEMGVDVRGYFYWSLLDNFEWDLGFSPRFGLVEVDYQTMERIVRPSAYAYKAIIESASV